MFVERSLNVCHNVPGEHSGNQFGRIHLHIPPTFTSNIHGTILNVHRLFKVYPIVSWEVCKWIIDRVHFL
jgi:hypothetical protein